jgi:hypothetical protein
MSEDNDDNLGDLGNIDSLLDQLKQGTSLAKKVEKQEFNLDKKDLEQFILNNTGKLIQDSMHTIDSIKDFIESAPEPEDVHSLAELYKASTSAIEALNKILLQQQKAETQVTIKTMDIQSKAALSEQKSDRLSFTREEVMQQLMSEGKLIEIEEDESTD